MKNVRKNTKKQKTQASIQAYSQKSDLVKTSILGIEVTNASDKEVLEYTISFLQNSPKRGYVVTPNPEIIVAASKKKDLKIILNNAILALCDGVGVAGASAFLGRPLKQRFSGTDFVENACEKLQDWPITVGFLGGRPKVAERAAECLKMKFPRLKVVFADDHWPGEPVEFSTEELILSKGPVTRHPHPTSSFISHSTVSSDRIGSLRALDEGLPLVPPSNLQSTNNTSPKIDLLFVAYGFPKQEYWMAAHLNKIPVKLMVGVGGALDYISGKVSRAPKIVQQAGLEWLYRLISEPWRVKRQLALVEFVVMVIKAKLAVYRQQQQMT